MEDLSKLSVVTEQGMFGELNIDDPTEKKLDKEDEEKDVNK